MFGSVIIFLFHFFLVRYWLAFNDMKHEKNHIFSFR